MSEQESKNLVPQNKEVGEIDIDKSFLFHIRTLLGLDVKGFVLLMHEENGFGLYRCQLNLTEELGLSESLRAILRYEVLEKNLEARTKESMDLIHTFKVTTDRLEQEIELLKIYATSEQLDRIQEELDKRKDVNYHEGNKSE